MNDIDQRLAEIVANNQQKEFLSGWGGAMQLFTSLVAPDRSALKYRAAQNLLAHRAMCRALAAQGRPRNHILSTWQHRANSALRQSLSGERA